MSDSRRAGVTAPDVMHRIAAFIVDKRVIFYLLFAAVCVYCALSVGKVRLNSDLTAFLSEETETRRGLEIMEDEFITYATANVMVSNVTYELGERLADEIAAMDAVTDVAFDGSRAHFVHAAALFTVSFDGPADDPAVAAAMEAILARLDGYDVYVQTEVGSDYSATLASEMLGVMLIAAAVIVAVLLLTSRSWFEVVIFFLVFAVAALMNMGTNYWFGEISSITNSVAVILQLALAIDYAIIFAHRYQDETQTHAPGREALVEALSKAIVEISSSSLTTIAGLVALTLMQFRLGYDLGIVLAKGIVCSLVTVFLLMPGLIMLFPGPLKRTLHRSLVPSIRPWGGFLMRSGGIFVWIFLIILPFAILFSGRTEYAFSDSSVDELVYSERRAAMRKITDTFDDSTAAAILVPAGDFQSEKAMLEEVSALRGVKSVTGLANIEIEEGHVLTDEYDPRMFAELLDIDVEAATLLYQLYGYRHRQYAPIFGDAGSYTVPLVDMLLFLFDISDEGVVSLDGANGDKVTQLRDTLRRAVEQLRGENWSRVVLTAAVPVEGEASLALTDSIRAIAEKYYGEGNILVVGDITSARDLAEAYSGDTARINFLTISFVFLILLLTLRSLAGSIILVFVIQGSIWLNFSVPYLMGYRASFVTYMIVSAIQMGATIDYAIVLMSRYLSFKQEGRAPREAMISAVDQSFATVLTSGSIMTLAGFLLSWRVSDVYVGHIGLAVGRGALISVILVLTVLPQLIVLLDKLVDETSFTFRRGGDRS